jgi:hypothetical protein
LTTYLLPTHFSQVNLADNGLGFTLTKIAADPRFHKLFPDDSEDEDEVEEAGDNTYTLLVEDRRNNGPSPSSQSTVDDPGICTALPSPVGTAA